MEESNKPSNEICSKEAIFNNDAMALGKAFTSILKIKVGEKAPDFSLLNADSQYVNLYESLKTNRVLLVFYRGTWCPYCNEMLKDYQSSYPKMKESGVILFAISPQTIDESLTVKEKNQLTFEILSDNGNIVTKNFTTIHNQPKNTLTKMTELGYDYDSYYADEGSEIPIPASFIIEQDGIISFAKSEGGDYRFRTSSSEFLDILGINH